MESETGVPTPPYEDLHLKAQQLPAPAPSTSISPSTSTSSASSRTAKSGNGSGNNATGTLKSSAAGHQHHHNSHRATKRTGSTASTSNQHHTSIAHHSSGAQSHGSPHHDDGRPKRVWKACERCRMKKTKCDGEFPCRRCKDDGLVCTAGTRKKTEYKQIPKGYAEVLENTQVALVATIHKLYAMVMSGQPWTLGEPELNERGQPVIHSIASKLGCIRQSNDPDLPFGSTVFPECDQDLVDLQSQLKDYHSLREAEQAAAAPASVPVPAAAPTPAESQPPNDARKKKPANVHARAKVTAALSSSAPTISLDTSLDINGNCQFDSVSSPDDLDALSDMDDYRKNVFGRSDSNNTGSSVQSASTTMSPQSLTYNDFDVAAVPSPTLPTAQYNNWMAQSRDADMDSTMQQTQSQRQAMQFQLQQQLCQQLRDDKAQAAVDFMQLQPRGFKQESPLSMSIPPPIVASSMPLMRSSYLMPDMLQQGMFESNFGDIKPHTMSFNNAAAMLGVGDPMIFDGRFEEGLS